MTFYIAIESAPFLENKESNVASFAVVIFNFVMVLVFFSSSVCVCVVALVCCYSIKVRFWKHLAAISVRSLCQSKSNL